MPYGYQVINYAVYLTYAKLCDANQITHKAIKIQIGQDKLVSLFENGKLQKVYSSAHEAVEDMLLIQNNKFLSEENIKYYKRINHNVSCR